MLVVDCMSIIDMDNKITEEGDFIPSTDHMIQMKTIMMHIRNIFNSLNVPYHINKVRGHSGKPSPRNWINNQVDKIASAYRIHGEASALLSELNRRKYN